MKHLFSDMQTKNTHHSIKDTAMKVLLLYQVIQYTLKKKKKQLSVLSCTEMFKYIKIITVIHTGLMLFKYYLVKALTTAIQNNIFNFCAHKTIICS